MPLNSIHGLLANAKECEDVQKIKEYIGDAEISLSIGLNMINDILDSAQIKNGNLRLNKLDFNLDTFIK